jgi:FtsH-binding integral membrane protein
LLPHRRKDVFSTAPEGVRKTIGGVPVISLAGTGMAIFSAVMAYASVSPAFAGALNPIFLLVVCIVYLIGVVVYAISYFVRRGQGLSLTSVMQQIPPE